MWTPLARDRETLIQLVRLRGMRRAIDAVRARYGRPPLRLPVSSPPPDLPS